MRIQYNKGSLEQDMIKSLEGIKIWSWTQLEDQWYLNLEKLKSFIIKNYTVL